MALPRDAGIGVIAAKNNTFGVTGIAGDASVAGQSVWGKYRKRDRRCGKRYRPGGIVIIELHAPGPADSTPCTCNQTQCNFLPMEYWADNFAAIQTATANHVIVVEAEAMARSISTNRVRRRFNRNVRDSGAILVGASLSSSRTPTCWTNFGDRVDVTTDGRKRHNARVWRRIYRRAWRRRQVLHVRL